MLSDGMPEDMSELRIASLWGSLEDTNDGNSYLRDVWPNSIYQTRDSNSGFPDAAFKSRAEGRLQDWHAVLPFSASGFPRTHSVTRGCFVRSVIPGLHANLSMPATNSAWRHPSFRLRKWTASQAAVLLLAALIRWHLRSWKGSETACRSKPMNISFLNKSSGVTMIGGKINHDIDWYWISLDTMPPKSPSSIYVDPSLSYCNITFVGNFRPLPCRRWI